MKKLLPFVALFLLVRCCAPKQIVRQHIAPLVFVEEDPMILMAHNYILVYEVPKADGSLLTLFFDSTNIKRCDNREFVEFVENAGGKYDHCKMTFDIVPDSTEGAELHNFCTIITIRVNKRSL